MLTVVQPMKQSTFLILVFFLSANMAEAAGVSLERLEDFNPKLDRIFVNVEVEVAIGCLVDPVNLEETFKGLLGVFGLQTASVDESQLEFAVSVKGLKASAEQACGIRQLSMARQIPGIKMLRLSPGSSSTRYRLWTVENIVTASGNDIQSSLKEQARKDVVTFTRALNQ